MFPVVCIIRWLHLCSGVRTTPNECPRYDTKQSDGEVPVMPSTLSLPLHPGPFRPGGVASERVLSIGQIEINCVLTLNGIDWDRIFVC